MKSWFGNMKIRWKMMLGFSLVCGITLIAGILTAIGVLSLREDLRIVYEDYTVAESELAHVSNNLGRQRNAALQALAASDREEFERFTHLAIELKDKIQKPLEAYATTVLRTSQGGRSEANDLHALRRALDDYFTAAEQLFALERERWGMGVKTDSAMTREKSRAALVKQVDQKLDAVRTTLDELLSTVSDVAKDMNEDGKLSGTRAMWSLSGSVAMAVLLGMVMGSLIARFIVGNLANVLTAAQALGRGDLGARSSVTTQDEVGQLAAVFNEMGAQLEEKVTQEQARATKVGVFMVEAKRVLGALAQGDLTDRMTDSCEGDLEPIKASINAALDNLTRTMTSVHHAVESVTSGSEQITKGNEDLSQRTNEQASALEETSASMEEMTSTVKQNADNAKQANQLAIAARDIADKGGSVTKKAVDAMGEINKSSKKIADIITVIDEIAFQTNLLALNAAVEAARAGEHGRGFAVVAAEVRNLAQRSATAAKEIKGLINESIQRVNDGSDLVNQSGKTLEEIVSSVKRVTDIIAEISAASQEQASGIDQVNKAIMSMDETTQQNAALVEETTAAAQSMKEQAKELLQQVEVFKTAQSGAPHAVHTAAKRGIPRLVGKPPVKPVSHGSGTKMLNKTTAGVSAESQEPVGVAAGNGKDRRHEEAEFEEF
jgi:methyl-accepting chemotaxis protein